MDCLEAQSLISQALDRAPVDAAALQEAKVHCRTCPECAAFVGALAAVQRAPLPEPPADLTDRVMNALTVDVARARAQQAREGTGNASAPGAAVARETATPALMDWKQRLSHPRTRRSLIVWASAAAVVLIAAGFGAISGVRQIMTPRTVTTMEAADSAGDTLTSIQPQTEGRTAAPEAAPDANAGATKLASSAPAYIVVNSTVYRMVSATASLTADSGLRRVGTTRSALDTGGESQSVDVYGTGDAPRLFVERESDSTLLAFDPVVRTFRGKTYRLQSGEIPAFGAWPVLPSSIPAPANADGTPTFTLVQEDPSGVPVYRLSSSSAERGIAIGPGTSANDPAAGNPGWTWWAPAQ